MSVESDKNLADPADLSRQLLKAAAERVMTVEPEEHPGYSKYPPDRS